MKKNFKFAVIALILLMSAAVLCACIPQHVHTYKSTLDFDETYHYYSADCGHDVTKDKAEHIFDGGTQDENGNIVYKCTVCPYEKTVYAAHTHQYGEWTVVTAPTLDSNGEEHRICSVCGDEETRIISKLTVTALTVTTKPSKTVYYENESFDPDGMVVTAALSDGSAITVTDYTADKTVLELGDTKVTVRWKNYFAEIPVTVQKNTALKSVSEAIKENDGVQLTVFGYYIGVADEGLNSDKEILLKDGVTDDVIAVRNVTGTFPDYGYKYGDKVQLICTVEKDGSTNTPEKRYLNYLAENGDVSETIISRGNKISYDFSDVVEVDGWQDMKSQFNVNSLDCYTYVRFSGTFYIHMYSGSDTDNFRFHMNASASKAADIKPDGTRAVCLRDNVMSENLGEDWQNLFYGINNSASYPGAAFSGTFTAIYTGANGTYFQLTVPEEGFAEIEYDNTNELILTEIAYAFYRQGTQIQYDQTQSRRNINPSPEDATAHNTLVLDCSSYVNACYYEAFGVNILPYSVTAKSPNTANFNAYAKAGGNDVVGYWENENYTTAAEQKTLLASVKAQLKVGDILCYRHGATGGSSGHVYIYVGNDTFLHCTGSSYSYSSTPLKSYDKATSIEKNQGAIQTISSYNIFENASNNRYLFYKSTSDSVWSFGIIRPLNRGLTPTAKSENRIVSQGLNFEKFCNIATNGAVQKGGTLTYSVYLENNSEKTMNVTIRDVVADGTTLVSTNGVSSGRNISWNISLQPNADYTASYSVTVALDKSGFVISSDTEVNGIAANVIRHTVSQIDEQDFAALVNLANTYGSSARTFTNPIEMAKTLYKDSLGMDLFDYATVSLTLTDLIDKTNNTAHTSAAVTKMLVPNMYGGLDIKSGYITDNGRIRMLCLPYLAVGDIIIAEYDGSSVVYVYLGGNVLLSIYSADKTAALVTVTNDAYTNILVTLISYDRYAVLRPSMVMS